MTIDKEIQRQKVVPVIDVSVRKLCQKPYGQNEKTKRYSHPEGCPNYGKRPTCPPQAQLWTEVCDLGAATWLFWTRFDLGAHREKMRTKHPNWSRRRLDCCRYWQKGARKPLRQQIEIYQKIPGSYATMCPEAMGINVTQIMHEIGIEIWPIEKWTYQVALGGWLLWP